MLLGLFIPFISLGIVLWFFLPGGGAGITYSPSQYAHAVQFRADEWTHRVVSVQGIVVATPPCRAQQCDLGTAPFLLVDQQPGTSPALQSALPANAIFILPQHESGWHSVLRRLFARGMASPLPIGMHGGEHLTITGTLAGKPVFGLPPYFQPVSL